MRGLFPLHFTVQRTPTLKQALSSLTGMFCFLMVTFDGVNTFRNL